MAKREPKPEDYETNEDFAWDMGFSPEDPEALYECSLCVAGKHDDCQAAAICLCRCFYNDHEEMW